MDPLKKVCKKTLNCGKIVRVYTNGITDADYIQPLFAFLITLANAGHCLRLPYNVMIVAVGH